jgi:histidine triad (HIT) family protein
MEDCLFCKIVKGEIPSSTVYEDDIIKVIMNINPNVNGHLLIIPKKHYTNLFDIDNEVITHSLDVTRDKLYPLLKERLHCEGLSIGQNNGLGQEIKHFHLHIMPRYQNDSADYCYNKELLKPYEDIFKELTK